MILFYFSKNACITSVILISEILDFSSSKITEAKVFFLEYTDIEKKMRINKKTQSLSLYLYLMTKVTG